MILKHQCLNTFSGYVYYTKEKLFFEDFDEHTLESNLQLCDRDLSAKGTCGQIVNSDR